MEAHVMPSEPGTSTPCGRLPTIALQRCRCNFLRCLSTVAGTMPGLNAVELYAFNISDTSGSGLAANDTFRATIQPAPDNDSLACQHSGQAVTVNLNSGNAALGRTVSRDGVITCTFRKAVREFDVTTGQLPAYNLSVTYQSSVADAASPLTVTPQSAFTAVAPLGHPTTAAGPSPALDNSSSAGTWTQTTGEPSISKLLCK